MSESPPPEDLDLAKFRGYLRSLAGRKLGQGPPAGDASDIVQSTLMEAYRNREQFRGGSERELAGWLGRILSFKIADRWRAWRRSERKIGRIQSLDGTEGDSSAPQRDKIALDQSSVGSSLERSERAERLADAMAKLPETQRRALLLRHCDGKSLAEIAATLGKTEGAVAGLLKRGLAELRELLPDQ